MTITQLQYVMAVAEYKNFTLAAEKTFVTQPTLSMQVRKLEDELGVLIFDRNNKPITLTEVGKKIVRQAKNIINESARIKDIVHQQRGFIGGNFRLGVIPTIMPTLLPMFLGHFIKKYPKVNLRVEEQHTTTIIQQLKDGYLDAAIAATPLEEENIQEHLLYYEPFVAYIPKDHRLYGTRKIKLSDLDVDDLLLLNDVHCFRNSVLNLCNTSKSIHHGHFQLESGSFETMIRLANEGLGMTLLPYLQTLELKESEKGNLHYFSIPEPARAVSLIYHKNELKTQVIQALKEVISAIIRGAITFHDVRIISPIRNTKKPIGHTMNVTDREHHIQK